MTTVEDKKSPDPKQTFAAWTDRLTILKVIDPRQVMRIYQPPSVAAASCRRVLCAIRRQDATATVKFLLPLVSRRIPYVVDPWHSKSARVPRDNQLVADDQDSIGAIASGEADGMDFIWFVGK